ncbi:hypothetical protein BgAZ_401510 [Babesia gibsoni]|uniref:Uncharacterized protein n=1 Tax=Babesia gibsoni TaxID=33632 RepID=A0AAD8LNQ7_BABGI|nr:hypothetical protein BgAZ_401510 [Babesia gibsoni]
MDLPAFYFELPVFQEHFGDSSSCPFKKLYVAMSLYEDVTNTKEVVDAASDSNGRAAEEEEEPLSSMSLNKFFKVFFDFDLVNIILQPEMITSVEHVTYAISRAITNVLNRKVHSGTLVAEIVYMLGGSSDVAKCAKEMCINSAETINTCKSLLAVTISKTKQFGTIASVIKGTPLPIDKLADITNESKIVKAFKFSKEELALPGGLNGAVLGRIGTKRI